MKKYTKSFANEQANRSYAIKLVQILLGASAPTPRDVLDGIIGTLNTPRAVWEVRNALGNMMQVERMQTICTDLKYRQPCDYSLHPDARKYARQWLLVKQGYEA